MRSWCGIVALAYVSAARADTGDTGDAPDTGPYLDTGATVEDVYTQDVGCGSKGAWMLPAFGLLFWRGRKR